MTRSTLTVWTIYRRPLDRPHASTSCARHVDDADLRIID